MDNYTEYLGKNVIIMTCSNCNVKCKHCYISYAGNFTGKDLYNLVSALYKKYTVLINGTEPLLHKDYLDSYRLAGYTSPITNGLVFKNNFDYIDQLKSYGINELRISYHFDLHDEISQVNKKYLQKLFKEIKKRDMKLCIMCSLSAKNYKYIHKYCCEAIKFGADAIKFTNFLSQGSAKELDKSLILTEENLNEFFNLLAEERKNTDKNVLEIRRCGSFGKDTAHKSNFRCDACRETVCITPDLKVYPCVFLCKKGNEIGFVKDNKIFIRKDMNVNNSTCLAKDSLNKI